MAASADHEVWFEHLVDAILHEAEEMDSDFTGWLEREAPRWRELGRDETWIRLRLETAQATRKLNRIMQAQGYSEAQRRAAIASAFTDLPSQPTAVPPDEIHYAMTVLGAEIGATIFDVAPTLTREQFLVRVDFLIQHEFGQEFLVGQSARARFTHERLMMYATQEFERLGGIFLATHRHGKRKRQQRKPREH